MFQVFVVHLDSNYTDRVITFSQREMAERFCYAINKGKGGSCNLVEPVTLNVFENHDFYIKE